IERCKNAWRKGVQPEDYDAARWESRLQALKESGANAARFDVALTVCAVRFVSDLRVGRINPKHFNFAISVEQKKYDLAQFLHDRLLPASDLAAVLDSAEPPFAGYRRSEAALVHYVELASKDNGEKLPASAKPIHAGQTYSGILRLAQLFLLVGDLPAEAAPPADSQIYDSALVEAVKRFQRRHGLKDDGRLGADTLKQLNVPLSDRVRQLQFS